jgi:hypothetical protein
MNIMGGNAFPRLNICRISRNDIHATLSYMTNTLQYPGLTLDYAINNLMGSALKQADSGDLDIAINTVPQRPFDHVSYPTFNLNLFLLQCYRLIGEKQINSKTRNGGQIQTAWPIKGNADLGFVQIDFISGDSQWLKFTHWSPGSDISPWKGVLISTMLGVLAKQKLDYNLVVNDVQIAKVGLFYDIEQGLCRRWFLVDTNQRLIQVDPDYFETRIENCRRFTRIGYITDPSVVIRLIFAKDFPISDIDTFEKIVKIAHHCFPENFFEIKEKFLFAFKRSAGKNSYTVDEISNSEIWLI